MIYFSGQLDPYDLADLRQCNKAFDCRLECNAWRCVIDMRPKLGKLQVVESAGGLEHGMAVYRSIRFHPIQ